MSAQDEDGLAPRVGNAGQADGHQNDSVANKLSKELNNWRRRRTHARSNRGERQSLSFQADAARTIKVRGHETLVIRKPKSGIKLPDSAEDLKR